MTAKELDRAIASVDNALQAIDSLKESAIKDLRVADLALLRQADLKLFGLRCDLTVDRAKENSLDVMAKAIGIARLD